MILTVDIGNTNITLGGFEGEALVFEARLATNAAKTSDEYASKILDTLSLYGVLVESITGAIISSVVPPLTAVMKKAIRFLHGIEALVVGPGIKTGISIHCDNPASVGADLICACVAAHHYYGSPSLVVDMGTATKMMIMDEGGVFIGASIIPGVAMGMKALASGTAQLPQVGLEAPPSVIAKNTVDCIRSGIVFGNAGIVDGMIDRINAAMGRELPVIATGGLSSVIIPHCTHKITMDGQLVLRGLYAIYKKNA